MPVIYGGDRAKFETRPGSVQHYLVSRGVGSTALSMWVSE